MFRALLSTALLMGLCATAFADSLTYKNSRFGTTATFPAEIFDMIDPPPTNGDGRLFRSSDGAELAIYGQLNALDYTPEGMVSYARDNAAAEGREVTYAASGKDWAVISGVEGGTIFYQRHEFGADNAIHSMVLSYPETQKALYDKLAGAIAGSLEGP